MPFVIGLTGGIGSGKSSVADLLGERGAAVIDTDAIAHRLTAPGQAGSAEIGRQFGADFLRADGALDRDRMRSLVFADPEARRKLESILHPMIRAEVLSAIAASTAPYVVLVVPLLVETGAYRELVGRTLLVDCPEKLQIERVRQRNNLAENTIRAIMASQAGRAARLAVADDVIVNDAGLDALGQRVAELHARYLALAGNAKPAVQAQVMPKKPR
jgi:dephospho-CoA kinase